jgi:hypothetical protein
MTKLLLILILVLTSCNNDNTEATARAQELCDTMMFQQFNIYYNSLLPIHANPETKASLKEVNSKYIEEVTQIHNTLARGYFYSPDVDKKVKTLLARVQENIDVNRDMANKTAAEMYSLMRDSAPEVHKVCNELYTGTFTRCKDSTPGTQTHVDCLKKEEPLMNIKKNFLSKHKVLKAMFRNNELGKRPDYFTKIDIMDMWNKSK